MGSNGMRGTIRQSAREKFRAKSELTLNGGGGLCPVMMH